jgi:hypothetical protein
VPNGHFLSHPSLTPHQGIRMANSATRRPWGSGGAPAASSGAKATPVRTPKEQLPAGAMAWTQVAAAAGSASPGELPMDRPPPASRADEMSVWEPTTSGSTRRPPWMWVPNELLPVGICGGRADPAARRRSWFSAVVGAALWRAAARRLPPRPAAVRR